MKELLKEHKEDIQASLLILTAVLLLINSYQLSTMSDILPSVTATNGEVTDSSEVIPRGVPNVYGKELKVSFDHVSPSNQQLANKVIQKLEKLDRDITLNAEEKERYINTLYNLEGGISCEYCCRAKSVIFKDGTAAWVALTHTLCEASLST